MTEEQIQKSLDGLHTFTDSLVLDFGFGSIEFSGQSALLLNSQIRAQLKILQESGNSAACTGTLPVSTPSTSLFCD